MNVVDIGKGKCRIIVRSKKKRERLERIPDVEIDGCRVIFPAWMTGNIQRIVEPRRRRKNPKPEQTDLFT